jgi:hypothetical protein
MTGDLDMDGNRVTGLADGTAMDDAATVGQIDRIGQPFPIWDHIDGVNAPDNSGARKYIRLTAGQSGAGGYNEGLLTDEQVSGSAPLVEADAEIAVGPLQGERVPLLNTEGAFIRPGISSGTLQFDQMQRITGDIRISRVTGASGGTSGATGMFTIPQTTGASGGNSTGAGTDNNGSQIGVDSSNSPNARVSSTTSGETRPKNRQATYYMRVV